MLVCALLVFYAFTGWYTIKDAAVPDIEEGKYLLTARVADQVTEQPDKHRSVITLKDAAADGKPVNGKLRLYVYSLGTGLEIGDEIRIGSAKLTYPRGYNNPGGFDFAAYLKKDGIYLCASADADDITVTADHATLKRALFRLREKLSQTADRAFGDASDIMKAILLGDRSGIDDGLYESFSRTGISHLIALSGLHVSAIALMLEWLFKKLRMPRTVRYTVTVLLLALYAVMTGSGHGTLRAVIMYALLCITTLAGYLSDTLTRLSQAFLIQLAYNPLLISDNGFVLSYASVAAILSFGFGISKRRKGIGRLLSAAAESGKASFSVQILTYPLLMGMYSSVPLLSVPVNMLCVPLAMLALFAGFVILCIGCVYAPLAMILSAPVRAIWKVIVSVSGFVGDLRFSTLSTGPWPWMLIVLFALAAAFGSAYLSQSKNRHIAGTTFAALIIFVTLLPAQPIDHLRITFLDVGSADGAVINAQGHSYAVDCGGDNGVEADYLINQRSALAGVFLTHPDIDHYGGVYDVLKRYPRTRIYLPVCWDDMAVPDELTEALSGKTVTYLCAGDTVELSKDATADVLWPPEGFAPKSDNDGSLVLLIRYAGRSVLMAGDITDSFDALCATRADILRVAHHGSKYATSQAFLDIVRPETAIISVGSNAHGHPTEEVLNRLNGIGATVYRTDECGAVFADIYANGEYYIDTYLDTEA